MVSDIEIIQFLFGVFLVEMIAHIALVVFLKKPQKNLNTLFLPF